MRLHLLLSLAGDSDGKVHLLDPRAAGGALSSLQLHKPGSKVNAVAVNPAGGASVVLTAGGCYRLQPAWLLRALTLADWGSLLL